MKFSFLPWMGSIILALEALTPGIALARGSDQLVSTGAGIASPGGTAEHGENPSGLVYRQGLGLEAGVYSRNRAFDPIGLSGHVYLGGSSIGGRLGVDYASPDARFDLGLGALIQTLNLAAGVSATFQDVPFGSGLDLDLGFIWNPRGRFRVGGTIMSVSSGIGGFGAGISAQLSDSARFVLDAGVNGQGQGLTTLPALGIHFDQLQLSLGYGIDVDQGSHGVLPTGGILGLGFALGSGVNLEAYYNHLAEYSAKLNFRL